jgi:hypothetical protein
MKQVLVRSARLHGNISEMLPADVLSEAVDKLRVAIHGRAGVQEVERKDTMPMLAVAGQPIVNFEAGNPAIPKQYPGSRSSLFRMING